MRYRMLKVVLFISSVASVLAGLQNSLVFDGTTLKFYDGQHDSATFGTAVVSCSQKGGELVMPKYKKLNDAVAQVAKKVSIAWIGGGDFFGEGSYEWNDGERHEWSNWAGEPDNFGGNENCMEILPPREGMWNDKDCCAKRGYVCQIPIIERRSYENSAFTAYDGYVDPMSYLEAEQFCKGHKSRLALLEDRDHFQTLLSKLETRTVMPFWVKSKQDQDSCISVSDDGVSYTDCLQSMSFICEQVAPHDLSVSDEQLFVELGIDLNINCSALGTPIPKVTWYHKGNYVAHQKRELGSSTLVLKDIGPDDFGMYVCKAVNEIDGQLRRMEGLSFIEGSMMLE